MALGLIWGGVLFSYQNGPDPDVNGILGDAACATAGCHVGNPVNASGGTITLSGLPAAWAPAQMYTLTVTISRSDAVKYGFQLSAVSDSSNTQAGTLGPGSNRVSVQTSAGIQYAQHNAIATSIAPFTGSFTVNWTAPSSTSAGTVRFNLAGNAANGNVQNTGDFIYTHVSRIPAASPSDPVINSLTAATPGLSQTMAALAGGPVTLTVNGENYGTMSKVYAGTAALTTTFVNSTQLTAVIPATSLRETKTLPITVSNEGLSTSGSVAVTIASSAAIGAYQVTIGYDKNIVTLNSANVTGGTGAGYTGTPFTVNIDNNGGTLILNHFQTGNTPSGTFTVARLDFTPAAAGTSNLSLTGTILSDISGSDLPLPPASVTLVPNSVTVTQGAGVSNSVDFRVVERGDVNGNRAVTIGDALVTALNVGGITKPPLPAAVADVNLSGTTNIGDALVLALFAGRLTPNLLTPTVTSVSPAAVNPGDNLVINGTGFADSAANERVLFRTVQGFIQIAPLASPAAPVMTTTMTVTVPNDAVSGPIQIVRIDPPMIGPLFPITVGDVPGPLILTSVNPYFKVIPGSPITLTGSGFSASAAANTVLFRGAGGPIAGTVTAASPTSLTVTVPLDAQCGDVTVTVAGHPSNALGFVPSGVTCTPFLSHFLGRVTAGDTLLIEGGGLDVITPSNNVVKFAAAGGGAVAGTTLQAGGTQLLVRVPENVSAGNVSLTVGSQTSNELTLDLPGPAVTGITQAGSVPASAIAQSSLPWTVQVNTASGVAKNTLVIFKKTAGNGSVSSGSLFTGADGRASIALTLGSTLGANTFEASVPGLAGKLTVSVTGVIGAAAQLAVIAGDGQVGEAGTAFPSPFVVEARDQFNNPVPGVTIGFSVTGRWVAPAVVTERTSGSDGRAEFRAAIGPAAGPVEVSASAAGLAAVRFNALSTLTPARLVMVSGNNQQGNPGSVLPAPLKVKVLNAADLPVPGVVISWNVLVGAGLISANQTTTDSNGETQITAALGLGATSYIATARGAVGLCCLAGSPVTFSATLTGAAGAINR